MRRMHPAQDLTLMVGDSRDELTVVVEFRAIFLATTSIEAIIDLGERIAARYIEGSPTEARVWRVDLCADATGLTFTREDLKGFVGRVRRMADYHCNGYSKKAAGHIRFTGYSFAQGNPLSVRLYDKTEELRAQHAVDSEKELTETRHFLENGWDGVSPVWRIEAQFKSEALKSLGMQSTASLRKNLDRLWAYVVGTEDNRDGWLRLTVPDE